jgi:hypothetical protein
VKREAVNVPGRVAGWSSCERTKTAAGREEPDRARTDAVGHHIPLAPSHWPRLFFTDAGLTSLRAMMTNGRLADPVKFAHVRQELGIEPIPARGREVRRRRCLRRESPLIVPIEGSSVRVYRGHSEQAV